MHECNAVEATRLRDVIEHLDATSAHARRDMQAYANGYAYVRHFMGYSIDCTDAPPDRLGRRDWLGNLGPFMSIRDAAGEDYSLRDYRRYITNEKSAKDDWGRERKLLAHRGILNPSDRIQFVFWHLANHRPDQCEKLMVATLRYISRWLHRLYGDVPVQVACHVRTGRVHWEWSAPKYTKKGVKTSPYVPWDSATRSVEHVNEFFRNRSRIPEGVRANSLLEIQLSLQLVRHLARKCLLKRVPKPTKEELEKAKQFFADLQLCSLRDGLKSRSPMRRNAARAMLAKKTLDRGKRAQEKLRQVAAAAANMEPKPGHDR